MSKLANEIPRRNISLTGKDRVALINKAWLLVNNRSSEPQSQADVVVMALKLLIDNSGISELPIVFSHEKSDNK